MLNARFSLLSMVVLLGLFSGCVIVNEGVAETTVAPVGGEVTHAVFATNVAFSAGDTALFGLSGSMTRIVLTTDPETCRDITYESGPISGPRVVLELARFDDAGKGISVSEAGTYSLMSHDPHAGLGFVGARLPGETEKGHCMEIEGEIFQGGTVTLESVKDGRAQGSFDLVDVSGQHLIGTFGAGECSAVNC